MEPPEELVMRSHFEVGSQRIPVFLTPSVALRGSRLSRPLYISESPTIRFFSAGPRFVSSSTVQSSINSSELDQDVDPSKKSGGSCVVMPPPAEYCNVDSARYAPTNDSVDSLITHLWDC